VLKVKAEWILRIGICGTFGGHGAFALSGNVAWIPFLTYWGFPDSTALALMHIIGALDLAIAFSMLVKPIRAVLLWATVWAFATALMRPITGGEILDFFERSANWAAPLALLLLMGIPRSFREWFR